MGSVLVVISNTQNSAALLSNQVFAPYGTPLSHNGNQISQYTNKGFTGQYNDSTSGLDYYVSRYYDSVSGVFLSADKTLGDATGMNPYSYVGHNPETNNDPKGQAYIPPGGGGGGGTGGNGNNNGNGNSGSGSGSGGGGGCGWWNAWCWFGGNGGNSGSGSSGSGTSHLPLNLMDSSPYGVGGEASEIQGPEGLGGSLDGQMAEADAELTEYGELLTLDAEVPQLVNDPGDALQAQALTEETVEAFKGDVGQEDVKEYGDATPVTTDTTTTTNTTSTSDTMNPNDVRFTQKAISSKGNITDGEGNVIGQYTVQGNIEGLQNGTLTPETLGPIRVFVKTPDMNEWGSMSGSGSLSRFSGDPANLEDGQIYSLDNRRLYTYQQAGITDMPVVWASEAEIQGLVWHMDTLNFGISIFLRP